MKRKARPTLEALVVGPESPDQTRLAELVFAALQGGAVGQCGTIEEALDALKTLDQCGFIVLSGPYDDAAIATFSDRARTTSAGKSALFLQAVSGAVLPEVDGVFKIEGRTFAPCAVNSMN